MSCVGLSLVGVDGVSAGVYPLRCQRWNCVSCGRRLVARTRRRIAMGLGVGPAQFITITMRGDEDPAASFEALTIRWKRLHQRLVRRFGPIEYVTVVELQKRGSPHLHVLVRGRPVSAAWLAKAAGEVGFGRVDVGPVHRGLAGYLTKAIGPGTSAASLPRYFHRIRWSARWAPAPLRRAARPWAAWHIVVAGPFIASRSAIARGYRVLELILGPPERRRPPCAVRWIPIDRAPRAETVNR